MISRSYTVGTNLDYFGEQNTTRPDSGGTDDGGVVFEVKLHRPRSRGSGTGAQRRNRRNAGGAPNSKMIQIFSMGSYIPPGGGVGGVRPEGGVLIFCGLPTGRDAEK